MTDEQLRQLFNAEVEGSAPDKDALWAKIESRLTPKTEIPPQSPLQANSQKKPLKFNAARYGAAAAACVALLMLIPMGMKLSSLGDSITSDEANSPSVNAPANEDMAVGEPSHEDMAVGDPADEAPSYIDGGDSDNESEKPTQPLSYEDLPFNSYSVTAYTCTGTPYGGSYFVEEDILSATDLILIGEVGRVYKSSDGSSVVYELTNAQDGSTVTVHSRSPYTMKRGRQYLLPLAAEGDEWRTVYDGVPQIEFTANGGLVYYNGWESLDTTTSQELIYPQESVDEFFYDRMMYLESGDFSGLMEKWNDLKNI